MFRATYSSYLLLVCLAKLVLLVCIRSTIVCAYEYHVWHGFCVGWNGQRDVGRYTSDLLHDRSAASETHQCQGHASIHTHHTDEVSTHMHACTHTHACMHTHIILDEVSTHMHACMHAYTCMHTHIILDEVSMHTHAYTRMHAKPHHTGRGQYAHARIHTHACTHTSYWTRSVCTRTHTHACMHTHILDEVSMHTHAHRCTHTHTGRGQYACVHARTHVQTHTHAHTHACIILDEVSTHTHARTHKHTHHAGSNLGLGIVELQLLWICHYSYNCFNLFNPEPRYFGVGDGCLRRWLDVNRVSL